MESKLVSSKALTSDSVTVTVKRKPNCIIEFQVKAKQPLMQKAYKEAIKSINKEISIPGFRKGKAPETLITSKYAGAIEERWKKTLVNLAFQESEHLVNIPPLNQDSKISLDIKSYSKEGADITFTFEGEPLVPPIAYEKIEITTEDQLEITPEQIDETIRQIQIFFAKYKEITDRKAEEGDFVIIDVDIIEGPSPQKALTNARFEVSKNGMAQWMKALITDLKAGESKEGESVPDESAKEEEKTPPKKVRLTVNTIQEPQLPTLNDDLAKKLGCKNLDEMRSNLKKLLTKQLDETTKKKRREQVSDALLANHPFELPQSLIDNEVQFRLNQLLSDPVYSKNLQSMDKEKQTAISNSIKTQGDRALRLFYLCRSIVKENHLSLDPDEVPHKVHTPLETLFAQEPDNYDVRAKPQEQKASAMSRLILTKAQDYALERLKTK